MERWNVRSDASVISIWKLGKGASRISNVKEAQTEQLAKRLAAKRSRSDVSSARPIEAAMDEEEQRQLEQIDEAMTKA